LPAQVESLAVFSRTRVQLADVPELDTSGPPTETWQPLQAPATRASRGRGSFGRDPQDQRVDAKTSLVDARRAVGGAVRILKNKKLKSASGTLSAFQPKGARTKVIPESARKKSRMKLSEDIGVCFWFSLSPWHRIGVLADKASGFLISRRAPWRPRHSATIR
jgi:hypothetical protein